MKKKKKTFLEECAEFEAWRDEQLIREWQLNNIPLTREANEPETDNRILIF